MSKIIEKFGKSFSKLLFPILSKFFFYLRINKRAANYFNEKSFFSNSKQNFEKIIKSLLNQQKLIALDVGAQGGFNSDQFIPSKYNSFFKPVLIEPIEEEATKLKETNEYVISNGLWSEKTKKKIYILGKRLGSSSMYEPDPGLFNLHKIKEKNFQNYEVTDMIDVECKTLSQSLNEIHINKLDYLKIDTQGAELEILKGIGSFKPLLIKLESHVFSMYKNVPSWNELIDYVYKLGYVLIDWKGIGSHSMRIPAEMDLILIPNFNEKKGIDLIKDNEEKFISLMLIFGYIDLLKLISKKNNFKSSDTLNNLEDYFFY